MLAEEKCKNKEQNKTPLTGLMASSTFSLATFPNTPRGGALLLDHKTTTAIEEVLLVNSRADRNLKLCGLLQTPRNAKKAFYLFLLQVIHKYFTTRCENSCCVETKETQ